MSGKKELKTAKEQLEKWDKILDEYELSVGLPDFISNYSNHETTSYLHMNRSQIEKMSPEDCGMAALILNELSFHIQRAYNREVARVNWADENVKEVVANEVGNYKGYSYQERLYQAVKNNEHARTLSRIKKYAKQRADRLGFLSSNMSKRADIFLSVQRSKRYTNVG